MTRPVATRKLLIRKLLKLVDENEDKFVAAIHADLGKPAFEFKVMELALVRNEAYDMLNHLDEWTGHQAVEKSGIEKLDDQYVLHDPLGVVLIIGAWNYPIQLTLMGLMGAIAGGNTAVLKPSEVSPNTAKLLSELIPKYIDDGVISVVNGGVDETTELLAQRFDHILYTGNSTVARIVMKAAAQNLTPVTLELGGKSPCVVHPSADLAITARRIMWGKFLNAGQTCVAPDYLLVHASIKDKLIEQLKKARTKLLGEDPKQTKDYGRIVNQRHFDRIMGLMSGGKVVFGGENDRETKYIAPTLIDNVDLSSPLMTDEIFGPVLPILTYTDDAEVLSFINVRNKPLALYIFSSDAKFTDSILENTSAGGVTVNDCLMHAGVASLPFGGVGESGMGAYHGKRTFDMFTHKKAVLKKKLAMEAVNQIRYPPYKEKNLKILMMIMGKGERGFFTPARVCVALMVCATVVAYLVKFR